MATFGGDAKVGKSITTDLERRVINYVVEWVPRGVKSYQLTLATIPISLFILFFSYLAAANIQWLWVVSGLIALQWLTDSLDGTVGRRNKEGLVRWGFYMDHFLDYVFLLAILIGYIFIFPDENRHLQYFTLVILGSFMVNSFLAYGATNEFRIAVMNLGPTEVRLFFIFVNTVLILLGPALFSGLLPFILAVSGLALCVVVYRTQKYIWGLDKNQAQ